MNRNPFIVGIAAFGMISGMFSPPLVSNATGAVLLLAPGLLIGSPHVLIFIAYLIGATFTIMLGGVPAAIYERVSGRRETDDISMWIWLAATAMLALPGVLTLLAIGF